MKNIFISLSVFGIFFLNSCEKTVSNKLSSGDGKWKIETAKFQSYENGELDVEETVSNYGTLYFDEKGTITFHIVDDGDNEYWGGLWSNEKETITLIIDGESQIFKILSNKGKSIKLEHTYESTYSSTTYKDVTTYELKKD